MRSRRCIRPGRGRIEPLEDRRLLTAVIQVTTTADSGAGSLRAAIITANTDSNTETIIEFDISGKGARTISPLSALPAITAQVDIQGATSSAGSPLIELDGAQAGANVNGLLFDRASSSNSKPSEVSGLIIDGFSKNGIDIEGNGPTDVFGSRIGTDPTGKQADANGNDGIFVNTIRCQIGQAGVGPAFQTLISGNTKNGIEIGGSGSSTIVQNCMVGTDVTGNSALANGSDGILVGTPFATIGGRRAHQGNLLSGNQTSGLEIDLGNCDVLGNRIGTNLAGTAAVANGLDGIAVNNAVNVSIGDSTNAGRNLVSGNSLDGIVLLNAQANIDNNLVGTDISGTLAVPNELNGILLQSASDDRIANCTIGGNDQAGIFFFTDSTSVTILQCFIGIDSTGTHAIPNSAGVDFSSNSSGNMVVNSTIADNDLAGVVVEDSTCIGDEVTQCNIFSNGTLGIQLTQSSTPLQNNDIGADGPNDLLNYPVLTSANVSGGHTAIDGTLNTTLINTFFTVQFFASNSADPSGFGEGQIFLGSTRVQTDGNGNGSFDASVDPAGFGQVITATAIATPSSPSDGDTSEFSQAIPVTGASITGKVFNDANGNRKLDSGEAGLKGRTVFVDVNQNGLFDSSVDPFATTNSKGNFRIFGLVPDAYRLRLLGTAGWMQTTPAPKSASQIVVVTALSTTGGVLFGQEKSTARAATLAVDAGSASPYVDLSGQTFAADTQHPLAAVPFPVGGTDDDPLYYFLFESSKFNYSFTVPNGKYVLKLYFADPSSVAKGQRTFNVAANGSTILKNFDIFATAGASKKAVVTSSNLIIKNKTLALSFKGVIGDAIVSAIELIPA